ncbi:hypothetical protein [Helicobacter ailurogastricus]|uniref:hypothetical protein n=1 Tax=Helicobacter ailurogastricus TaxID=1578720 RepID=UPI000CF0CCE7|nr:hypothetical protein [Helicobacter ailurogastricus]
MLVEIPDSLAQKLQAVLGVQSLKKALEEFIHQREVLEPNQEALEAIRELQEGRNLNFLCKSS